MPRKLGDTRHVALRREERAIYWRARRATYDEIARHLEDEGLGKVRKSAIGSMVKRAASRRIAELRESADALMEEQFSTLDYLMEEAQKAWERSKSEARVAKQRTVRRPGEAGDDGRPGPAVEDRAEEAMELRDRTGEPKYLDIIRECLKQKARLAGLDAPERFQVQFSADRGLGPDGPGRMRVIVVTPPAGTPLDPEGDDAIDAGGRALGPPLE